MNMRFRLVNTDNPRVSPREKLRLLENEHRCLMQRQDQLLNEVVESDMPDQYLLSVVNRLRSIEHEIERVRASCN
jgi:hypothetical protein